MCFGFQVIWWERIPRDGEEENYKRRDVQDANALIALCKEWDIKEEDLPKSLLAAKDTCLCPVSSADVDMLIGKVIGAMLRSFYKVELNWL